MHGIGEQGKKRTLRQTLFVVVGMFGFGVALVPLYDVFCDVILYGKYVLQLPDIAFRPQMGS